MPTKNGVLCRAMLGCLECLIIYMLRRLFLEATGPLSRSIPGTAFEAISTYFQAVVPTEQLRVPEKQLIGLFTLFRRTAHRTKTYLRIFALDIHM